MNGGRLMEKEKKSYKVLLCIVTIVLSILASSLGFGLLEDSGMTFLMRFLCGLVFVMTPLSVIWLIIVLFKKK